jgi:hypothetical protein
VYFVTLASLSAAVKALQNINTRLATAAHSKLSCSLGVYLSQATYSSSCVAWFTEELVKRGSIKIEFIESTGKYPCMTLANPKTVCRYDH